MNIISVKLNPFGGLSNKEITLENGLNVAVGPNEAGKSTLFNAIQKVMFTPTKINKRTFDKEIKKFLPIGGGDTIEVELQFKNYDKIYTLTRMWGDSKLSKLILSDGALITNDDTIADKLESLLPAKEGTFKSVLLAHQSGLSKTLEDLKNDPDTRYSLKDIIRKTVLETDGVSIDDFKDRIEKMHTDYFSHWDCQQNYPEKNRSVNNPWKNKVGSILNAFYSIESAHNDLEYAEDFEEKLDQINKELFDCGKIINEMTTFVKDNKKAVEAARTGQALDEALEGLRVQIEHLNEVNKSWPNIESKISALEIAIPKYKGEIDILTKEKEDAERQDKNKEIIAKFENVSKKQDLLNGAKEQLQKVKQLGDEELEVIRSAHYKVEELKTGIEARKLTIDVQAKKTLSFSIQKGIDETSSQTIDSGRSICIEADGRVKIEHDDWMIEARSGTGEIEEILKEYKDATEKLYELFKKYGIESVETAIELNRIYNDHVNDVINAENNLADELGSDTYEDLKKAIDDIGDIKETRTLATIIEELTDIKNKCKNDGHALTELKKQIDGYIEKYDNKEKLLSEISEKNEAKKENETKIKELASLLDDVDDLDSFIKHYENTEANLDNANEKKFELIQKKGELEKEMPDESVEELQEQLLQSKEDYERVLKKGNSITRVMEMTHKLMDETDTDLYVELKHDLEDFVSIMTDNRYTQVNLDEGLPQGFIRGDGNLIEYDLLSVGTKDILAIALRFSMAKHFLEDTDGFLIMDDPLVDLDPERQKKASDIINDFANEKQVLIFTCHPSHAEILGGNIIEV
ncbi:MAG: AAA family ATPase [Methanosarcinales archaeon]|nr:AAA family ATPase [Methanosarcinales archaeon]